LPALQHVLAVGLVVTQLSGCSLLDLLFGFPPPFDPDEPFPLPTLEASFSTGSATLELDGETIVLDELAGEAGISADVGYSVRWEDGEGRYLSLYGSPDFGGLPSSQYLTLDWINGDEHWVIVDTMRCVTTIDQADGDGLRGSATCRGLQWGDYFDMSSISGFPEPIEGQAPFDAEITFEAR
jgi:hypothetical protein